MTKQIDQTIAALRATIEHDYQPGDRLPTEPVLATELGVSRATIREAISRLEIGGLVERRWGVGTFVLEPIANKGFGLLTPRPGIAASLAALGGTVSMTHIDECWDAPDPETFPDFPDAITLRLERVYALDGIPCMMVRDHIVAANDGRTIDLGDSDWLSLLIPDLLDEIGLDFHNFELQLEARLPHRDEQHHLQIQPTEPLLATEGTATDAEGRLLLTVATAVRTTIVRPVASAVVQPRR